MNNNKEKAKEFSQICGAFCDTIDEKYSDLDDCGILVIAVNATDPENVKHQTAVIGDGAALTYGLLKSVHSKNSPVLQLLKMTAEISKLHTLMHVFNLNNGDKEV